MIKFFVLLLKYNCILIPINRGTFPVEQGGLHLHWKVVSKRLREFQQCIVLPIGSLSMGLCRHRAILFKVRDFVVCLFAHQEFLLVL